TSHPSGVRPCAVHFLQTLHTYGVPERGKAPPFPLMKIGHSAKLFSATPEELNVCRTEATRRRHPGGVLFAGADFRIARTHCTPPGCDLALYIFYKHCTPTVCPRGGRLRLSLS